MMFPNNTFMPPRNNRKELEVIIVNARIFIQDIGNNRKELEAMDRENEFVSIALEVTTEKNWKSSK